MARPKIIAPVLGETQQDIIAAAHSCAASRADMVEWRADYFRPRGLAASWPAGASYMEDVLSTLSVLRDILPHKQVIFTCRTKAEGGRLDIDPLNYTALNLAVAGSGLVDMVDVEVFSIGEEARRLIAAIQAANVRVIGSYHDFSATPPLEEILFRLRTMRQLGADITKIAVTPHCVADVLILLNATVMAAEQLDCPLITVAMTDIGKLSRIAGGICGSAATFGRVGPASAPGQIPVEDLARMLDMLHDA